MKNMRSLFAVGALLSVGLCWAPIEDKPDGAKFHGELSDRQLSQYQNGGIVNPGASAGQPGDLSDSGSGGSSGPDRKAGSVLANATNDSKALSTLQSAQKEVEAEKGPNFGMMSVIGGLLLVLGVGAAYGVRTFLDRTVPEAPVRKKSKNSSR